MLLTTLERIHSKGFVHGDIRLPNILFCPNEIDAFIIDFNLANKEGTFYPSTYNHNRIPERHPIALANRRRLKEHDLYSISFLLGKLLSLLHH